MSVQCLSSSWLLDRSGSSADGEPGKSKRPEEGKHPDKQIKRTEETSKLPGPEPGSTSLGVPSLGGESPVPGPQEGTIHPLLPAAAACPQSSWDVRLCKGTLKLLKSTSCFLMHRPTPLLLQHP